jgi:hypothetical protein
MQADESAPGGAGAPSSAANSLSSGLRWQDASLLGRDEGEGVEGEAVDADEGLGAPELGGAGGAHGHGGSRGGESGREGGRAASAGSAAPRGVLDDTGDRVEYVPGAGLGEWAAGGDQGVAGGRSPRPGEVWPGGLPAPHGKRQPSSAAERGRDPARPLSASRPLSANARPVSAPRCPKTSPACIPPTRALFHPPKVPC